MLNGVVSITLIFGVSSLIVGSCIMLALTVTDLQHSLSELNAILEKGKKSADRSSNSKEQLLDTFELYFKMKT